jgi:hydrogenase-4 membrane subunit HyfE
MIQLVAWLSIAFGLGTVVVRRRSVSILLIACQSAAIGVAAIVLAPGRSQEFFTAAVVLIVKAVVLTVLLVAAVLRTRESARIRSDVDPLLRLALTLAAILVANLLIPAMPGVTPDIQRASIALLCIGAAVFMLRRATLLQLVGVLVAENGLALAAVSVAGGMPAVVELGALFDLTLVISVAIAFHDRIYLLLGSGDSALLTELRD